MGKITKTRLISYGFLFGIPLIPALVMGFLFSSYMVGLAAYAIGFIAWLITLANLYNS